VVFKKFILGSLLVVGLTACPIVEPPIEPTPKSPIAKDDVADTGIAQNKTIKPYENDEKGDAELVRSSIDLNVNVEGQQFSFKDSTRGTFTLNTSTGDVTFVPASTAKAGEFASARYTIKDSNGKVSSAATIKVTLSGTPPTGPIRILFIGNSRTVYNGCNTPTPGPSYDIPTILKSIAASETRTLEAQTLAYCGYSLEQHWNAGTVPGTARGRIAERKWDYVVLQANTAETDTVTELQTQVSRFNTEIKAAGAKTILYMNWWKSTVSTQTSVTAVFKQVATNLTIKMAPIGEAWRLSGFTDTKLFNTDGDFVHATPTGAYTAATTFYWMFYGKFPPINADGTPKFLLTGVTGTDAITAMSGAQKAYNALESNFRLP
jgi:Surface adhesin CshA repetitive domain